MWSCCWLIHQWHQFFRVGTSVQTTHNGLNAGRSPVRHTGVVRYKGTLALAVAAGKHGDEAVLHVGSEDEDEADGHPHVDGLRVRHSRQLKGTHFVNGYCFLPHSLTHECYSYCLFFVTTHLGILIAIVFLSSHSIALSLNHIEFVFCQRLCLQ